MSQVFFTRWADNLAHAHASLGESDENPLLYTIPYLVNTAVLPYLPQGSMAYNIGTYTLVIHRALTVHFVGRFIRRLKEPRAAPATRTKFHMAARHLSEWADGFAQEFANLGAWYENPLCYIFAYLVTVAIYQNIPKGTIVSAFTLAWVITLASFAIEFAYAADGRRERPIEETNDPHWEVLEAEAEESKPVDVVVMELRMIYRNIDQAKAVKRQVDKAITKVKAELQSAGRDLQYICQDVDDSEWEVIENPETESESLTTVKTELETLRSDIEQAKAVHKRIGRSIVEGRRELRFLRDACRASR